ncbi:hypothetical protein BH10ACI2_BH10ACI2_00850 [soil metagenome]
MILGKETQRAVACSHRIGRSFAGCTYPVGPAPTFLGLPIFLKH